MKRVLSNTTLEIEPYRYSASWLIGATTHAADRFVPDVERILQPDREHVGGTITFGLTNVPEIIPALNRKSRKYRLRNKLWPTPLIDLDDRVVFDARENQYFNWSHQVNFFLTLALAARSTAKQPITILLPSGMPRAALDLYKHFGFEVTATDGPVKARNFNWSVSHNEVVPSARPQLIRSFMTRHDEDESIFPKFEHLPRNVFLSRRGSRSISNEAEVETLLRARGFEKVYAEDLSIPQQFALLRQADQIVAIHGAGLAPLQYRSLSAPPVQLVELAPVGIVTRWFGIMCEQVGGKYISVRGRLKAKYIDGLYRSEPFVQYCDDNFHIDPKSLEVALEMIDMAYTNTF